MKTTKSIFGVLKITLGRTGRICTSSLVPLLLLVLMLPVSGAQAAVVFTSLYSFTGTNDGANPMAGLVQGSDGYFYGTTQWGGTNNTGTVFRINTNGALTTLYSFTGDNDGGNPQATLVQGSDGYFYGTTEGGYGTYGTVFRISSNGALTTLYSFSGGNDGAYPNGLVQGHDGYLYGTTGYLNLNPNAPFLGNGTVFKISTNGVLTTLYSFTGYSDGANPSAGLVQGTDGSFYGTTYYGGVYVEPGFWGWGTVFKISTNGALTSSYSFDWNDGIYPMAGLVQGSDGNLYGTTSGGPPGLSRVFKISTNGGYTSWGCAAYPVAALVQGRDGNLYGTTEYTSVRGGPQQGFYYCGAGTVFKTSTTGALTTLYAFGSITNANGDLLDGASPCAALVQGSDGSFYGTTWGGGAYTNGTVFRLTIVPDPQLTIIPSGPYVILTWPTDYNGFSYAGYMLQSTTNLGSSAVWTTNSSPPVVIGGQNVVINTISGRQQFYRLSQ